MGLVNVETCQICYDYSKYTNFENKSKVIWIRFGNYHSSIEAYAYLFYKEHFLNCVMAYV